MVDVASKQLLLAIMASAVSVQVKKEQAMNTMACEFSFKSRHTHRGSKPIGYGRRWRRKARIEKVQQNVTKARRRAQSSGLVLALASRSKGFEGSREGFTKGCPRTKTARIF